MAATMGKWEREIKIPTGGYSIVITETTGPSTVTATFAATETYYWSSVGDQAADFPATLASKLTTASIATGNSLTYTCTIGAGEGGTGKLTIAVSSDTITINTGSTTAGALSLIGFTSAPAAAASIVSQQHCQALWIPDSYWDNKFGTADYGWTESNTRSSESASGDVSVVGGGRSKRVMDVTYNGLTRAKVRIAGEVTTGESLETFYQNDLRGDNGYCAQPGGPVRWYQDADADATYTTLKIADLARHDPELVQPFFTHRWNYTFRRCVVQS